MALMEQRLAQQQQDSNVLLRNATQSAFDHGVAAAAAQSISQLRTMTPESFVDSEMPQAPFHPVEGLTMRPMFTF